MADTLLHVLTGSMLNAYTSNKPYKYSQEYSKVRGWLLTVAFCLTITMKVVIKYLLNCVGSTRACRKVAFAVAVNIPADCKVQ